MKSSSVRGDDQPPGLLLGQQRPPASLTSSRSWRSWSSSERPERVAADVDERGDRCVGGLGGQSRGGDAVTVTWSTWLLGDAVTDRCSPAASGVVPEHVRRRHRSTCGLLQQLGVGVDGDLGRDELGRWRP